MCHRRLAQEKASKLRSPNFFVSPTRLAVHNVPKDLDEKQLKQLVLAAVKERATKQVPQLKQVTAQASPRGTLEQRRGSL